MFLIALFWCFYVWSIEGVVLDPSLYLAPRPPLSPLNTPPPALSPRSAETRSRADVTFDAENRIGPASKRSPQPAAKARFFWPSYRSSPNIGGGSIQVPLTFSLSGLYGKYAAGPSATSIIGSSYGTVSEIAGTAVASLAGSGYGKFRPYVGMRIYGGERGPAWGGWGNGKWGHYGRG